MIGELGERYHVHVLTAVLKRDNRRSLRLLERLGFSLATTELHAKHGVEPSEVMMQRMVLPPHR